MGVGMPSLIHNTPTDDVIAHEDSERCVCGPHREPIGYRQVGQTGQHVFALIHARLATREMWEV